MTAGSPQSATQRHLLRGIVVMVLSAFVIAAPVLVGDWALALVGLLIAAIGVLELADVFYAPERRVRASAYLGGLLAVLAGLLLFLRPTMVLSGLIVLLAAIMAMDGVQRILVAVRGPASDRVWGLAAGAFSLALAVLIWWLRSAFGTFAVGVLVGVWGLTHGWAMLMAPRRDADDFRRSPFEAHPDRALELTPSQVIAQTHSAIREREAQRYTIDLAWCSTLVIVFFAIHLGRMQVPWTWLGMVAPVVAVIGDLLGALLVTAALIIPSRLLWRKVTRPLERSAWADRLAANEDRRTQPFTERLRDLWLYGRLRFAVRLEQARESIWNALFLGLKSGLPVVAVLIAVNPIWGFSWYFNSENWTSALWQAVAGRRTVAWREHMVKAVEQGFAPGSSALSELFQVSPSDVDNGQDFSFLVIGDPGEGDASQFALKTSYLRAGSNPNVRFVVISSDVIYPDGAMKDYEPNFYLPLQGLTQPIYAIPGNHDWFNALDSFTANFFKPDVARAAIQARVDADAGLTRTTERGIEDLVREAQRLRAEYRLLTGQQRAPFFEVQTPHFALLALDTGVLRRLDNEQGKWFKDALERSRGKFIMALLGHPLYAGGHYEGKASADMAEIHALLRKHEVPLVMAGDTHDFEYYREMYASGSGPRAMHHFVNGGGGAYLSIGTALDWPKYPPVTDFAFYPSTQAVLDKLSAETPLWKWPIWLWVRKLNAWPASPEALSAIFDFNYAPFFQSFMEVQVRPSKGVVRLLLYGVNGRLPWRELQTGGNVIPPGDSPESPVVFEIPIQ